MPKYSVAQYGLMTRDEKSKIKPLTDIALLFDGRRGVAYRKMRIYVCKCGMRFRECLTFRLHAARRHDAHLPFDTDCIPCLERMEWMPIRLRRKVF